jgi:biopolymer transport protein ExbD
MRLTSPRTARKAEVMMAPLIDCVFLLLMFYAVTTQFVSDERLKLKLPEAKTAESAGQGQEQRPPVVKIAEDGSVWIDEEEIPTRELEARIKALVQRAPDKSVIIMGDRGADYGVVIQVLDAARAVGATTIQMSAEKPVPQGP